MGLKRAFSTDDPERRSTLTEAWELRPDMGPVGAWNDEEATEEQEEGRMHSIPSELQM